MKRLVWVRTSPPDMPGSMSAYGDLVCMAMAPVPADWTVATCDLFDPHGGSAMWKHHVWRMRNARRALAGRPADLYHWLDASMAAFIPAGYLSRSVATVHDLIPLLQRRGELPGRPSWPAAWLIRRGVDALRGCAALCADSAATKADLARLAGIAARIAVVPVPLRPLPPPRPAAIAGLASGDRFILHVGHNAAYKNRAGVLDVFAQLRDVPDVHLVMVDLRNSEMDGQQGEDLLAACGITINRNTVPFDPRPASVASGLRIGTSALATRGFGPKEYEEVADIIGTALAAGPSADVTALKARVDKLAEDFPLYPDLDQIH